MGDFPVACDGCGRYADHVTFRSDGQKKIRRPFDGAPDVVLYGRYFCDRCIDG